LIANTSKSVAFRIVVVVVDRSELKSARRGGTSFEVQYSCFHSSVVVNGHRVNCGTLSGLVYVR
jgi:hypothetical protein